MNQKLKASSKKEDHKNDHKVDHKISGQKASSFSSTSLTKKKITTAAVIPVQRHSTSPSKSESGVADKADK